MAAMKDIVHEQIAESVAELAKKKALLVRVSDVLEKNMLAAAKGNDITLSAGEWAAVAALAALAMVVVNGCIAAAGADPQVN